jgi:rhodanese-related sulfurtransferase
LGVSAPDAPTPFDAPSLDFEQVRARLRDPSVTIVNVLARAAFEEGRIPGSLSLPLADIPERAHALLPDRERSIVVYCASFT